MSIFDILAEERIRRALDRGELAGLPGEGQPLEFDDDCLVPAELRMTNRILRNAGCTPPALADLRALALQVKALASEEVAADSRAGQRKLASLLLRLEAAGLSHVAAALMRRCAAQADNARMPLK